MKTEVLSNHRTELDTPKSSHLLSGFKSCSETEKNFSVVRRSSRGLSHAFVRDDPVAVKKNDPYRTTALSSADLHLSVVRIEKDPPKSLPQCARVNTPESSTGIDKLHKSHNLEQLKTFLEKHLNPAYLAESFDTPLSRTLLSQMDSYLSLPVALLLQLSEVSQFLDHLNFSSRPTKLLSVIHSSSLLSLRPGLTTSPVAEARSEFLALRVGPTSHVSPTSLCTLAFQCNSSDREAVAVLQALNRDKVQSALPELRVLIVEPPPQRENMTGGPLLAYVTFPNCTDAFRALALLQAKPLHAGFAVQVRFEKPSNQKEESSRSTASRVRVPRPPLPVGTTGTPVSQCLPAFDHFPSTPSAIHNINDRVETDHKGLVASKSKICPAPSAPPPLVDTTVGGLVNHLGDEGTAHQYRAPFSGTGVSNLDRPDNDLSLAKDDLLHNGSISTNLSCPFKKNTSQHHSAILGGTDFSDSTTECKEPDAPTNAKAIPIPTISGTSLSSAGDGGSFSDLHSGRKSKLDPCAAPWMGWIASHSSEPPGTSLVSVATPIEGIRRCRYDPYIGDTVLCIEYSNFKERKITDGGAALTKALSFVSGNRAVGCINHFKDPLKVVIQRRRAKNCSVSTNVSSGDNSPSSEFDTQSLAGECQKFIYAHNNSTVANNAT